MKRTRSLQTCYKLERQRMMPLPLLPRTDVRRVLQAYTVAATNGVPLMVIPRGIPCIEYRHSPNTTAASQRLSKAAYLDKTPSFALIQNERRRQNPAAHVATTDHSTHTESTHTACACQSNASQGMARAKERLSAWPALKHSANEKQRATSLAAATCSRRSENSALLLASGPKRGWPGKCI